MFQLKLQAGTFRPIERHYCDDNNNNDIKWDADVDTNERQRWDGPSSPRLRVSQ